MPRVIDPGNGSAIGLDDLVDALDAHDFDVRCEDSFASAGPLLARLGRNRDFLADLAIESLKGRCADQALAIPIPRRYFCCGPAMVAICCAPIFGRRRVMPLSGQAALRLFSMKWRMTIISRS